MSAEGDGRKSILKVGREEVYFKRRRDSMSGEEGNLFQGMDGLYVRERGGLYVSLCQGKGKVYVRERRESMSGEGGTLCQGEEGVYFRGRRDSISGQRGSVCQGKKVVHVKGVYIK